MTYGARNSGETRGFRRPGQQSGLQALPTTRVRDLSAVALTNAANDAAAAAAGVGIGETYRNGSVLMVRVS
ncbi:hypothetical protein [Sphingomonas sp. URHD0057]|uniref:hypothetical protein n=1 Tax=Sphingomonas sp. URHD0057 TaxID=1380389 RepID=UPI00048A8089|nr:hypothetical protein [Sphingomonas sp. URHD0057]